MKREKIYISGKISGLDFDEACRRFGEAEKHLQKLGYRTSNPTKMRIPVFLAQHGHYRWCLLLQLAWLWMTCDCIFLMDGWHTSDGARLERAAARVLGKTAMYQGKMKPRGEVPAPTHVLTPEKKTSKKHKKD